MQRKLNFKLFAAGIFAALLGGMTPAAAQNVTQWGWPQPYEKVSEESIAWLKEKGWWPIVVGWQGPFSGQNTINVIMDKEHLLQKRGIEAKFQAFASGPEVNESVASARIQVGNGGNFPFTSLLDRGVPVRAIAVVAPNLKHSTVVPLDSPIKKLADFKGSNPLSPQVVFGKAGFIRVHIESVSVLSRGLGQVRFIREEYRDSGQEKVTRWVATIGFEWHPDALISNADRTINPLGFQVSDYHTDSVTQ